ncbi:response regulator [Sphingomonas crocodyli]|uniref:Response regulator n=1 Tax=Sphingomonas crocodyli TaxID=1979270 RepID=A0A437M722_9SPHN|nr:response regulator [Sphingomonas crocodyli]RVT93356.1 response regulator [Sphingomonas crocodyli]
MLKDLRILIVEDQPIIAFAVQEMLHELRAEIVGPVKTLAEAIDLVSTQHFDAALIDVWLKGEASFPIGNLLASKGIPFMVMSGLANEGEPQSFQDAPRLLKPFTLDELKAGFANSGLFRGR